MVYVFDTDGLLLNATGQTIELNLSPDSYKRFEHGVIERRLEVSVPTKVDTFLRIGIEDVPTNKFGVVEVPVSTISHLPPLSAQAPASAPAPSNTAPTSPAPSTSARTTRQAAGLN